MLYVQQSLGPNEELVHIGRFHWMYTVNAFMSIFWGIVSSVLVVMGAIYVYQLMGKYPPGMNLLDQIRYLHPGIRILAFIVFILGLMSFARLMVVKATTEIAVTNS